MAANDRNRMRSSAEDNDDRAEDANDRAVAKVRQRAQSRQREQESNDEPDDNPQPRGARHRHEEEVEIEVGGDEDDDGDENDDGDDEPRRGRSRPSKSNRYREAMESAREANERSARQAEEIARLNGAMQVLLRGGQQTRQDPGPDPFDAKINDIRERRRGLQREFAALDPAKVTEQQFADYEAKAHRLEDELADAQFEKRAAAKGFQAPNPANAARDAMLARHPEIANNRALQQAIQGHFHLLTAKGGRPGPQLLEQAVQAAKRELRIGEHAPSRNAGPRPDPSKYAAPPRGAPGGGGGEGRVKVALGPHEKRMAENLYPELAKKSPEKAWKKWAEGPGRRIAKSRKAV